MKFCPNCKTTYSDDTLSYCLSDGTNLMAMPDADATVQMSGGTNPMRVNIAPETQPTVVSPLIQPAQTPPHQNAGQGVNPWLVVPLILILFISVAGLLGYILLKPTETAVSNSPTAAPTATPNSETAALKEELESLKKQIANQNTKSEPDVRPFPNSNPNLPATQIARVNSPNDGFLALRSLPDSESGDRLAKIPHGANLEIIGCQKFSVKIGSRRGRWCRTNYNGQGGWVFDGFLSY